jgi:VWFA-related protein
MPIGKGIMSAPSPAALAALGLLLLPSLGLPQAPPPERPAETAEVFPSGVELVTVDVVVVDKKGRAVPGFERSDFTVLEEGVPQAVTSFEAVTLPPRGAEEREAAPARPRVSVNQGQESRQHRTFVVVFDDVHLSPAQALRAKASVGEFLRTGARDGDVVTLIATAGSAWWTARMPEGREELVGILKRLDGRYITTSTPDRVTEYEAMRIVEYDDPDVAYQVQRRFDAYGTIGRDRAASRDYRDTLDRTAVVGLIDPYVRSQAVDVHRQGTSRRRVTMRTMTRALEALADARGRKAMILVSQGFVFQPGFPETRRLVEASTRANVPIHFIDTRGLVALPDFMTASFTVNVDIQDTVAVLADITREAEGSENVALDTGGIVVKNTNDLSRGILRVSEESQAFYLLGYLPRNVARDGKFRKIEVRLARERSRNVRVRARRGYYAPLEGDAKERETRADPVIVRALDAPFEIRDLPLRVTDFCFDEALSNQLSVLVAAEVDVEALDLREAEGRFRGELALVVEAQHMETGEYFRIEDKIEMAMLPRTREQLRRTGYVVSREFNLPAGGYQAKVVVRDLASGRVGSVIHDFRVPDSRQFRLSTPVLSDSLEERSVGAEGPPRPVLRVRRQFEPGSILYVQYSVLGAAKGGTSYLPEVRGRYEIRRADGSVFKSSEETVISPTSIGALLRLHGISLAGAQPGEYDLVLRVRDQISGKRLEVREPFLIAAGNARSAAGSPPPPSAR